MSAQADIYEFINGQVGDSEIFMEFDHQMMLDSIDTLNAALLTAESNGGVVVNVNIGTDTVEMGDAWTDAGATADGGEPVIASGTVDTNTVGTYTINYSASDACGNTGTATRTVTVVDTTAPVITVTPGTDTVELGSAWTDAGATADGGETVFESGSVDTNTVGNYTITYTASDAAGNVGTVTRTVLVVDTTAPVITVTSGTDTVEQGSSWTDAGATADGGEAVIPSGTVDTNTVGAYTITYTATDAAGNVGTATRTVTVNAAPASWSTQEMTGTTLMGVYFTDANTGWAVGLAGQIVNTTDGGASWTAQASGTTATLQDVHFTDANTGWAVGSSGTILHTIDGGATWAAQTAAGAHNLDGVYFHDAVNGWIVGYYGVIWNTADGGATWTEQISTLSADHLQNVQITDVNTGWAVGNLGTILHTTDGGATWPSLTTGTTDHFVDLYFIDAVNGWIVGQNGIIWNTADGGATWVEQTSGTLATLGGVHFTDANTGWISGGGTVPSSGGVGYEGLILHTTDGGANWNVQVSSLPVNWTGILRKLHFTDAGNGWAVGDQGYIIKL